MSDICLVYNDNNCDTLNINHCQLIIGDIHELRKWNSQCPYNWSILLDISLKVELQYNKGIRFFLVYFKCLLNQCFYNKSVFQYIKNYNYCISLSLQQKSFCSIFKCEMKCLIAMNWKWELTIHLGRWKSHHLGWWNSINRSWIWWFLVFHLKKQQTNNL